ncbi:SPFH domain-containing protein [Streptomyces sp. NPDC001568]|uniref:SPFH domain-containing protein n=1 Tax=Streptomyces sp. NPDC001568 TaxID=3364588 RepID=UPI0036BCD17A
MYPTRTTSTTGTLHVPPALLPTRHTPATEPPTAARPPASHPGDARAADPESGPGSVPAADRTPRSGAFPTAGSDAWTSAPARGHSREAQSWSAYRPQGGEAPAGSVVGVAGASDPLGRVRPEPASIGTRTSAADQSSQDRSGHAAPAGSARGGTEYPARGAEPGAESASPYAARSAAYAEAVPPASGSGARARARGADQVSQYRSGHDGLAAEAALEGRPEAERRVRVSAEAAPATARPGTEHPGRIPAEGRVQEYAGAQAQVPAPVGAIGSEPPNPVSGRGVGVLAPEGQAPSPAARAAATVPAGGVEPQSAPGGRFAGPEAQPARPHPQDAAVVGVPAARPDPAVPEAPAPRRGRWIEVPTSGRGRSYPAPDRERTPATPDPTGVDSPGLMPSREGARTAPDSTGVNSSGSVPGREGIRTAPDPTGVDSSGSVPSREGIPAASSPHGGGGSAPVPTRNAGPADPETGDATPSGSASRSAEGPAAFRSVPQHAGIPAAQDPRGSDTGSPASRYTAIPGAPDPRGDVLVVAPAQAEAGSGTALDIPHPAPGAAPSHPRSELWPAEAPADPPTGSGIPGPDPGPDGAGHPTPAPAGPAPDVTELVARAVARGMDGAREDDDTQDLPHVRPVRGAAVTEIPVHLPFRAHPIPARTPAHATPAPDPEAAGRTRRPGGSARLPAGRRVPRGDDRLREHRGPVLPGWFALAVGALAMTGCAALLWRAGIVPAALAEAFGVTPRPYRGLRATHWPPLAFLGIVTLLALGGLGRAKAGHAWVLTLFGRYRGTVRRTGLTWVSPLLLRRRVDVRLRHWRSEPMPAVDSGGLALQVVVQVVWQVKDTARATLAVEDHTEYLAEQVESAMARVLSQLPADAFHADAPTLRDAEAVGDALTRMLAAETEAVGVEVFSAQPTRIEYAPEVAEAMRRRRVAAIDAKHRDAVLSSVVDAVDDTVHRLTSRGIVELDDYERKALVKDLTVAFYTGRADQ